MSTAIEKHMEAARALIGVEGAGTVISLDEPEAVDYRALLVKYMHHVGLCEGTTFVSGVRPEGLTDPEWEALRAIDEGTVTT